jgi:tRNA 2-selenouridine synthase
MDFKSLFKNDVPLIDVRAPIEFEAGHFPMSVNLPIMSNEDRHLVGTCYKESGQDAAIKLGHERVSGAIKEARVNAWLEFKRRNPNAVLHCFRGGLRSRISQQWMKEAGVEIEIIPGGYKKMRQFLLETIEESSHSRKFMIMAGRTGSGKTAFLKNVSVNFMDLEKHANHKGSSFGLMGAQPSQITFENRVAVDFIKQDPKRLTMVESESIMIGSVHVPRVLFAKMSESPMIVLEKTMDERVNHIVQEYVFEKTESFGGDYQKTFDFMMEALERIQKKLGGLNFTLIKKELTQAFQSDDKNTVEVHRAWVEGLLIHYYDHFYNRSLKKNESRIVFKGNTAECTEFLRNQK